MKLPMCFILLITMTGLAAADPAGDAIKASQAWQMALARAVNDVVNQGQRDPKTIAKLATEKTQSEEKKVRETGKAMGVSAKELDESIKRDRKENLDEYIKDALSHARK